MYKFVVVLICSGCMITCEALRNMMYLEVNRNGNANILYVVVSGMVAIVSNAIIQIASIAHVNIHPFDLHRKNYFVIKFMTMSFLIAMICMLGLKTNESILYTDEHSISYIYRYTIPLALSFTFKTKLNVNIASRRAVNVLVLCAGIISIPFDSYHLNINNLILNLVDSVLIFVVIRLLKHVMMNPDLSDYYRLSPLMIMANSSAIVFLITAIPATRDFTETTIHNTLWNSRMYYITLFYFLCTILSIYCFLQIGHIISFNLSFITALLGTTIASMIINGKDVVFSFIIMLMSLLIYTKLSYTWFPNHKLRFGFHRIIFI